MLILVTDGKSQDDVRTAAQILKDQNINVFVVGEPAQCPGPRLECSWLGGLWVTDTSVFGLTSTERLGDLQLPHR